LYRGFRVRKIALALLLEAGDEFVMRSFPFRYQRRLLKIGAMLTAAGWELWVFEADQRLAYGSRLSAAEEVEGWQFGQDRLWILAEEVKSNILTGRLPVPPIPVHVIHQSRETGLDEQSAA
jgi:hypothetical protein